VLLVIAQKKSLQTLNGLVLVVIAKLVAPVDVLQMERVNAPPGNVNVDDVFAGNFKQALMFSTVTHRPRNIDSMRAAAVLYGAKSMLSV